MPASTTPVLPTDPGARKAWSYYVGKEAANKQYFSRMMGGEGSKSVIVKRTELQKGQGDEITTLITAKLQGAPRVGTERLEGTEKRITQFDTKIKIGLIREGVNVGSIMDEQRTGQQLGAIGREVLADWLAEYMEQFVHCHIAGDVGVGSCMTNVRGADGNFKKIEMPLLPIDDKHRMIGPAGNTAAGALTDANVMTLTTLTVSARNKLSKMYGGINGAKIELIVADDEGKPGGAALAARKLATSGVVAVIGTYGSAVTEASQRIYDEAGIRRTARALKAAFGWNPGFREYFAVKATPNPFILKILHEEGCGVDCSSETELMLSGASGFAGHEIIFSSNETQGREFARA